MQIFLQPRDGKCTGWFGHNACVFEYVLDRRADFVSRYQYDFVDQILRDAKTLMSNLAYRGTIGEHANTRQTHGATCTQRGMQGRCVLGLDADHPDLRIQRLRIRGDTSDQTTATDRHHDAPDLIAMALAQNLHGNRALSGDHIRIVERMHEAQPFDLLKFARMRVGAVEVVAMQDNFATEVGDGLQLDARCGCRHHDHCAQTELARRKRHALCVIAGGGTDHTACACRHVE